MSDTLAPSCHERPPTRLLGRVTPSTQIWVDAEGFFEGEAVVNLSTSAIEQEQVNLDDPYPEANQVRGMGPGRRVGMVCDDFGLSTGGVGIVWCWPKGVGGVPQIQEARRGWDSDRGFSLSPPPPPRSHGRRLASQSMLQRLVL